MAALNPNDTTSIEDNELIVFDGGAIKALGNGVYGGYGVLFTTDQDPDLQGEFFTKATEFELEDRGSVPVYWHHGLDPALKARRLGRATFRVDDAGIWFETKLQERDDYEKYIKRLADMGKLGWSTGATSHLVGKNPTSKAMELTRWPVGELSLDHRPVEPRTTAIAIKSLDTTSLKALIEEAQESETEEVVTVSLEGLPGLKALCEALSPANIKMSQHSEIADAAVKELLIHGTVFVDAFKGYRTRIERHAEFRKERGKHISQAQEESLKSWREGISKVRADLQTIEGDLETTLKAAEFSRSEVDAANKHAEFLSQQLANLSSIIAKE